MTIPQKTIIQYFPAFLNYYQKNLYSVKTQENYKRFLNKFIFWLRKNNLEALKPDELTPLHISGYKTFLASHKDPKTDKILEVITQNYYLIALRALLRYFITEDIESILPDKISLIRADKREKKKILALNQIDDILGFPNTQTEIGLRDRVILELLVNTGLKVSQLVKINRDQVETSSGLLNFSSCIHFPQKVLFWINKYLEKRKDRQEALLINYRSSKGFNTRLTPRSVERTINKYGKKLGLPYPLTPENLRWACAVGFLNSDFDIEIKKIHDFIPSLPLEKYNNIINLNNPINSKEEKAKNISWASIEKAINRKITWLKDTISTTPEGYKRNLPILDCDDCILRKLAILIVSGQIQIINFVGKISLFNSDNGDNIVNYHGKEWHQNTINIFLKYFKNKNYKIIFQPLLNYGMADLGVIFNSKKVYIEVGTVSLYKLWFNFLTMKNTIFWVVPSDDKIIMFKI